ncbi:MAG: SMP-30/gluconolactonase/LRE family protein [Kiloniellales bacterium]|nr:SMP-30/gluconolactonase/LRE family protein [Kiloniellales bacterium]
MLDLDDLTFLGSGLARPECVLTHHSGYLFASDWTEGGGVSVIDRAGRVSRVLARNPEIPLRPNGIALLPGGSFLLAHLGAEEGGVWRLDPDGRSELILAEVDGEALPPTNFVHIDARGRLWVTVSTRTRPRSLAYRRDVADGYVILVDRGSARVVADGLGYTNECAIDPSGERLYVNETFARRLICFEISPSGDLSNKTVVAEFGAGTFPDGLTFDAEGAVWITSIVSNRVVRVAADGSQETLIEDSDTGHMAAVETAYEAGRMGRPQLDRIVSRRLRNLSSLAFGGTDLRRGYLGCLLGDSIAVAEMPVAGHAPTHWNYDLTGLWRELARREDDAIARA